MRFIQEFKTFLQSSVTVISPVLGKPNQVDPEYKSGMDYTGRPCWEEGKKKGGREEERTPAFPGHMTCL